LLDNLGLPNDVIFSTDELMESEKAKSNPMFNEVDQSKKDMLKGNYFRFTKDPLTLG
jgi:hypothetical protein